MPGENLVLALNAEMFLANYIAGFLNFNISQTIGVIELLGDKKLILFMQRHIYEGNKVIIKCR